MRLETKRSETERRRAFPSTQVHERESPVLAAITTTTTTGLADERKESSPVFRSSLDNIERGID